jgi:proliferating cell nuclear antigen
MAEAPDPEVAKAVADLPAPAEPPIPTVAEAVKEIPSPVDVYFRYADASAFSKVLDALLVLVNEAAFDFSDEKLYLRVMDPSHVAMVELSMPRELFEEWSVPAPAGKPVRLCMNLESVKKLIGSRVRKDDSIALKYTTTESSFALTLQSKNQRNYKILKLESEEVVTPAPKINFRARRRLVLGSFLELLKDAEKTADHAVIVMDMNSTDIRNSFKIRAGGDLGNYEGTMSDEDLLDGATNEPTKTTFSLSYLKPIVEALHKITDIVDLELSTDLPIKLSVNIGFNGTLTYYMAPRIESP